MKTSTFFNLIATVFLTLYMSSCDIVGGIFKTGIGVGVFVAVAVVVLIVMLLLKANKRRD